MNEAPFVSHDFHFIFLAGLSGAPRVCVEPQLVTLRWRNLVERVAE
jgi:hypothetical protein